MYCPNCGKQNPDDAKFCESCGAPNGAVETPKAAPPPPPPPPHQYSAPPPPPPPAYAAPVQQQYYHQPPSYSTTEGNGSSAPMSVGQYLGTLILLGIPLVGFILMLVWAFGSDVNKNKKNLCRAALILMLIGIVLGIVLGGVLGGLIASILDSVNYY